jgi:2-polyprenyl-3-methyl-5-hydroxy-6-metoxy-1,4-benzoquinol methylase
MAFAGILKKSLLRAAPGLYTQLQEVWTSRRIDRITRAIVKRHGLVVLDGPFAGMRYVPQAAGSSLLPKLLGCYEAELHPTLTSVFSLNYRQVVDVGCAEGYYAVGLATRILEARVFAFDTDMQAREYLGLQLISQLANSTTSFPQQ